MAENIQPNSISDPNKAAEILQYAAEYAANQSTDLEAVSQATYNYAVSHGVVENIASEYASQFAQYFISVRLQKEEQERAEKEAVKAEDEIAESLPFEEYNPNAQYNQDAPSDGSSEEDEAPVLLEEVSYTPKSEPVLEDLGGVLLEEPVYQSGSATKTDVEDEDLASILLVDDTYDDSNRERKTLDDDIGLVLLDDDTYDDSNRRNTALDDMEGPVLMAEMTAEEKTGPTSDELLAQDTEEVVLAEDTFDDKAFREERKKALEESLDNAEEDKDIQLDSMGDEYKSTYVRKQTQDEIEAKKKTSSAAYKAKMALGDTSGKVSEESRRMYRELRAEQNARLAKKGMFMIFIVFILGVVSAVLLYMFINYTPMPAEYEGTKVVKLLQEYSTYYCAALGVVSLMAILRIGFIKSLASLMYVANVVLMIPCFTLLSARPENGTLNTILYIGVIIVSMFNCFFFNTSDAIEMYYKRKDTNMTY